MTKVSEPRTTLNIEPPSLAAGITPHKVLLVSQGIGANFISGVITSNLGSVPSVEAVVGKRSVFANAYRAFRAINKVTQVDSIVYSDAAGDQAEATAELSGAATEDGTICLAVASAKSFKYELDVKIGDTATDIMAALVVLITADEEVPVTAASALGVLTLTAANAGVVGNGIGFGFECYKIAGITVVGATPFSGGTGAPDTSTIEDVIGDSRYQTIIWDESLDGEVIADLLDSRFNVANDILDGIALLTLTDTFSNISAYADAFNSNSLIVLARELNVVVDDKSALLGGDILEWNPMHTAQVAAARSLRLTDGANIISLLTGAVGLDARGGAALGSRPYFNTPFPNMNLAPIGVGFTDIEIEQLKTAGASVLGNNRARTGVIAGEIVTTYKTDNAGNPDESYKFLNTVDTVSLIREYFWNNYKKRFAQTRLTLGDLVEGRPMVNPSAVLTYSTKLYNDLSESDYALTQAGSIAGKAFKDNVDINFDMVNGLVLFDANVVPIVVQYRETFGKIKFAFNPSAA